MNSKRALVAFLFIISCLGVVTLGSNSSAEAAASGLKSHCNTVRRLVRSEIWKSKQSPHIPSSDARKFSTSFIVNMGTLGPKGTCLYAYDSKGNLIHKLGQYGARGVGYTVRMYGGWGCGDKKSPSVIAATAIRNTGSPAIYVTSGTGNCAVIPDPRVCINSAGC